MTKNLTAGPPARLILGFTLPLIAGNIFQQLYAFVDTLIVGRWLGVRALAAVGCTGCLMFLMIGFILGATNGLAIVTGQRFGAGDAAGLRRSAAASVIVAAIMGVTLAVTFVLGARPLLSFMETPPEIIDDAVLFFSIIGASAPLFVAMALAVNVIRVLGNSKVPTVILAVALLTNIAFEPLFILVLKWGIAGAALGTTVGQVVGAVIGYGYIYKYVPELHARGDDWRVTARELKEHAFMGLPVGFQLSVVALGEIILQVYLNRLGPIAVASYAAAQKVETIAIMPMISFGLAMAAFAAQNFGAGKFTRITQGMKATMLMSGGFAVAVGVLLFSFGRLLMGLFVEGEQAAQVVENGYTYFMVNVWGYIVVAFLFILRNTLQGLGQTAAPTFGGVMELIMRGFAGIVLVDMFGFLGACWAGPLAWLGALIPLAWSYFHLSRNFARDEARILAAKEEFAGRITN